MDDFNKLEFCLNTLFEMFTLIPNLKNFIRIQFILFKIYGVTLIYSKNLKYNKSLPADTENVHQITVFERGNV